MNSDIEVAHFGNFVPEYENGTAIPRDTFYLHHILAYDQVGRRAGRTARARRRSRDAPTQTNGHFVAGCSNERSNWGPDNLCGGRRAGARAAAA